MFLKGVFESVILDLWLLVMLKILKDTVRFK